MLLMQTRSIEFQVRGRVTSDGAGVKLTRVFERDLHERLDPFLMLDFFGSASPDDYIAGFPDHPHRGFETITYMLAGRMRHRDSYGHEGVLESGGVQWMTAGRGIIHSEIPEQESGEMRGLQLWLNLPARDKLCEPGYRDLPAPELPVVEGSGVRAIVIAGTYAGIAGPIQRTATQPLLIDFSLAAGARVEHALPASHHVACYVYAGRAVIAGQTVESGHLAVLTQDGAGVLIEALEPAQVFLLAGHPLHEPIVQHGPFVMNTEAEIRQTLEDLRTGRLGQPNAD
jgi:redox-sensitive bicupin YhaK (pirin superfamily)